jgi:hypothetical protein
MSGKEICDLKIKYKKRKKAWEQSLYYFIRYGSYGTPYKCKYCGKYHLTSKHAQPPAPQFIREFNQWYGAQVL